MAVRNEERHLSAALESILTQDEDSLEVVLVDDGSRDATADVAARAAARDPRVRVITNEFGLGMGQSFNRGLAASRAGYVARMDGDDLSLPGRLRAQAAFLDEHPEVGVVGGHVLLMDSKGAPVGERRYPLSDSDLKRRMFRFSPFAHPATMYRVDAVRHAGGYDQRFTPAEDLDLWFKVGRSWRFATVDRAVLRYRLHASSVTARRGALMQWQTLRVRLRGALRYGYRPSPLDAAYSLAQLAALPVPYRFKMRLFEWYRRGGA